MKKILLIVLAVAVLFCLPLTAQAKTEFELGGYIRLDAMWNSQGAMTYSLAGYSQRNNVVNANHGKFLMNANATRFNFTIKGPELWGGKVTGFIEVDFDGGDTVEANTPGIGLATSDSSFNQAKLRLRHAMFKINWPDREFLFGQFWSVNSEMIPEVADSGAYCLYGATQLRIPQVRFTYKFTDEFNASLALCAPQNGRWGLNLDNTNRLEGETGETPMVEAKARYEQDLWGKAAWYGKPRAFYVGLGAGYFRSRNVPAQFVNTRSQNWTFDPVTATWLASSGITTTNNWNTLGQNNFFSPNQAPAAPVAAPATPATAGVTINNQFIMNVNRMRYHDHWLFLIENFTPIVPTTTKNLAGSLGLAHQWWIGQGVSAWRLDLPGSDRYYQFTGVGNNGVAQNAVFDYDMTFIKRYGGWAQLQYYWTNEIFTNVNFGFEKAFGFNPNRDAFLSNVNLPFWNNTANTYANPVGYDPISSVWRVGVTQWYRPVAAVKFALQYTYMRTNYFQRTSFVGVNAAGAAQQNQDPRFQRNPTNYGDNHSIMANAWYMF